MTKELTFKDMNWLVGGFNSYWKDDCKEECCKCGRTIYFRPYVDLSRKEKLICLECVAKK